MDFAFANGFSILVPVCRFPVRYSVSGACMSKRFILGLMAANQTGVLAAVATALAELGGDIDEASQTVMQGFFTIIIAADFPEHRDPEVIKGHLEGVCRPFGVEVILKDPAQEPLQELPSEGVERYFLTLTGHDTPGVVAQISARLARERIDITDLHGMRRAGDHSFVLILELAVPVGVNAEVLRTELEQLGRPIGLCATLEHEADFRSTNDSLRKRIGKSH